MTGESARLKKASFTASAITRGMVRRLTVKAE